MSDKPSMRSGWVASGFVAFAVTVIAMTVALVVSLSGGSGSEPYQPGSPTALTWAKDMCREFTRDVLKAPATAEFVDGAKAEFDGARYYVTGQVDAENGYGALIRNDYECQLSTKDGNEWSEINGGALVTSPGGY